MDFLTGRELSAAAVVQHYWAIRGFCFFLMHEGVIPANPALLAIPPRVPTSWPMPGAGGFAPWRSGASTDLAGASGRSGLAAARARGSMLGPRSVDPAAVAELLAKGHSQAETARRLGVSRRTIRRASLMPSAPA